jgi:hypothetical protein
MPMEILFSLMKSPCLDVHGFKTLHFNPRKGSYLRYSSPTAEEVHLALLWCA